MEDVTFYKYLVGLITMMGSLLFGWTHMRASAAHQKIDVERRENEARFNECYDHLRTQSEKTEACRQKLETDISDRMTGAEVKDFVDRAIKPIENSISAVHTDVKLILSDKIKENKG